MCKAPCVQACLDLVKPALGMGSALVAATTLLVAAACGRFDSTVTLTNRSEDARAITSAFNDWERLPSTCQALLVPGSVKAATISSSGVSWAIATFKPVPDCSYTQPPAWPGGPPRPVPVRQIGPWGRPSPPIGVFEKQPGRPWSMNQEGGTPFPCPAPAGNAPGPENGSIPPEVLAKWNLKYAPDCSNVSYPMRPRVNLP